MVAKGEEGGGEMNWEFGINIYTLLYIKWINDKNVLKSTENCTLYPVITYNEKECEKNIYITGSLHHTLETNTTLEINKTALNKKIDFLFYRLQTLARRTTMYGCYRNLP